MAEITTAILSLIPKCPITFEPMIDPIIVDGKKCKCCVSRSAFEDWKSQQQSRLSSLFVCPRCNGPLNTLNIQPNTSLEEVISNIKSFSRISDLKEYGRRYKEDTVLFKCCIMRRANAFNTPWILNKARKNDPKQTTRFVLEEKDIVPSTKPNPPTQPCIMEEYTIAMSNLENTRDLKRQIRFLSGMMNVANFKLFRAEEVVMPGCRSVVQQQTRLIPGPLIDEQIPCIQLANPAARTSVLLAFETTLRYRPSPDDSTSSITSGDPNQKDREELENLLSVYGNAEECRLYDTETLPIAMAISRTMWPRTEDELTLGLRVDAIDHRECWYPGSVVEIIDGKENKDGKVNGGKTCLRVHFDSFSSKWDEMYTINHFNEGRLRPLHSQTSPSSKSRGFIVHHRYINSESRLSNLFGQSFCVEFQNEWTTARAGAQILAQASRFLRQGPLAFDVADGRKRRIENLYARTQAVISDLIDVLVDSDREYVHNALGMAANQKSNTSNATIVEKYRNATSLASSLVKQVNRLHQRLPFEVRICMANAPLGVDNEDVVAYPFSVMRSIGNYMNVRHAIVLQWREPPTDKTAIGEARTNYLGAPVMYVPPKIHIADNPAEMLNQTNQSGES